MRILKVLVIALSSLILTASTMNTVSERSEPKVLHTVIALEPTPVIQFPSKKQVTAEIVTTRKPDVPKTTPREAVAVNNTGTWESVFNSMANKLPGNYVIQDRGSWGATDLSSGTVYIAPRTPLKYLDDVMLHESIHVRQGQVYGNIGSARSALANFGGLEAVADCGARMLGATWTNYVSSCTTSMNHAATAMLNGVPA